MNIPKNDNINEKLISSQSQGLKLQNIYKKEELNLLFQTLQDNLLAKYTTITTKRLEKDTDTESVSGTQKFSTRKSLFTSGTPDDCLASPLSDLTLASPEGATAT